MKLGTVLSLTLVLAVAFSGGVAHAGSIGLVGDSLDNLLGGNVSQVAGPLCSDTSSGNMLSEVCSSTYTGDNGLYVYLYQLSNTGTFGNSSIDTFTLFPFWGASDASEIGYLTDLTCTGGEFLSGGYDPLPEGFVELPGTGPVISYYYSKNAGADIPVGEHSLVMYVKSDREPGEIIGNVIDGSIGTGAVLGPVPEPCTLLGIVLGAFGLMSLRIGRRR